MFADRTDLAPVCNPWFWAYTTKFRVHQTGARSTNGKLYKYNKATATETPLTWASPTLKCLTSGRSILWNPARNTLIFIAEQNGLNAVTEYDLP
mgnify:CR=1 FL=1